MKTALDLGANCWNAGEFYGPPGASSLELLHAYFGKYPEDASKVVLSMKGALNTAKMAPDGTPEGIRKSVDHCLAVLAGRKKIDIFECARLDPDVPFETSIGVLVEYVKAGKIGGIGLSEVSGPTIRKLAKIHPIAAVELEMSLFSTELLADGSAAACAELGIPIVAYSPLGRGFLTGQIKSVDDIPPGDFRLHSPRFQKEVFDENMKLVKAVEHVADKKGCSVGQVAMAWVMAQNGKKGMPVFVPIPGATTEARVKENMTEVKLSGAELAELQNAMDTIPILGGRYPDHHDRFLNQ